MMVSRRGFGTWLGAALLASATGGDGHANPAVPRLHWYGQSCFLLETPAGTRVVMDPLSEAPGYALPEDLRADLVTISHEHGDHNNLALVKGSPKVLRGLTSDRKGWMKIRERHKDVAVRSIGVYHDDKSGGKHGLNSIFVFETAGLRIAHLGDLGHELGDRALSELGSVDVVLVPVGGQTTIDADAAARVVDQMRPRLIVVPMHHRTAAAGTQELAGVDAFLAGRPHVRREAGNWIEITALKKRPGAEVVVLSHQ